MKTLKIAALLSVACAILIFPVTVSALEKGTGRLVSVIPVDGGCVSGPTGATVEFWGIEPGYTYTVGSGSTYTPHFSLYICPASAITRSAVVY